MLPNLSQILLHDVANTKGFYAPTKAELENEYEDPITHESPVVPMTFRVWLKNDSLGKPIYKFFNPWALWTWIMNNNSLPSREGSVWYEDWWALCEAYNPQSKRGVRAHTPPQFAYTLEKEVEFRENLVNEERVRARLSSASVQRREEAASAAEARAEREVAQSRARARARFFWDEEDNQPMYHSTIAREDHDQPWNQPMYQNTIAHDDHEQPWYSLPAHEEEEPVYQSTIAHEEDESVYESTVAHEEEDTIRYRSNGSYYSNNVDSPMDEPDDEDDADDADTPAPQYPVFRSSNDNMYA